MENVIEYIGCMYHAMHKKKLLNNSIVLLYGDIKPQSLVTSNCYTTKY